MLFRREKNIDRDRKVSEDELDMEKKKDEFTVLVEAEADHDIKYRTLSWKKTAYLLVCEYFGLASMALPWSFSVLGWGTAMTVLIVAGMVTWCEYAVRGARLTTRHVVHHVEVLHEAPGHARHRRRRGQAVSALLAHGTRGHERDAHHQLGADDGLPHLHWRQE